MVSGASIGLVRKKSSPSLQIGNPDLYYVGNCSMRETNRNARRYSGPHVLQLIATATESAHHVGAGQPVPEIVLEAAATGVESGVDCPIGIASNNEADDMTIGVRVAERSDGSGSQFRHR